MKTWRKKIKIAVLAIACVLGIAGCSAGSRIETELTINKDLSGVRTMHVAIDPTVFAENFHGDIDALNGVIKAKCPKELSWKHNNQEGIDRYEVTLEFKSPEDYKKKVESITGEEKRLELSAPNTIWANGFRIYENFSSSDLLEWMGAALVEAKLIEESSVSYLFEAGSSKVTWQDEVFETGSSIHVNQLQYLPLDRIDMLTNVKGLNSFDRKVAFFIPTTSMSAKKAEIEAFLNGNVPDGAASEWSVYEAGTVMTISGENMDLAGLNAFNKKVLASEKNQIEVTARGQEDNLFVFADAWGEQIDVSAYAGDESGRVSVQYFIKAENGMELEANPEAKSRFRMQENDSYRDYGLVRAEKISEVEMDFLMKKGYPVQHTQVVTKVKGTDRYERSTVLTLAEIPEADHQTGMLNALGAKGGELAEVTAAEAETGYQITISQNGSSEQIAESNEALFGKSGSLKKVSEQGLLDMKHRFVFSESFDYEGLITATTEDYMLSYEGHLGILDRVTTKPSEDNLDAFQVKGKTVSYETPGQSVKIHLAGNRINLIAMFIWMVILGVAGFLGWNLKRTGVFAMAAEDIQTWKEQMAVKRQEAVATRAAAGQKPETMQGDAQAAMQEAAAAMQPEMMHEDVQAAMPEMAAMQPEIAAETQPARFCSECGHRLDEGAVFCEECGTRQER